MVYEISKQVPTSVRRNKKRGWVITMEIIIAIIKSYTAEFVKKTQHRST